MLTSLLNAVFGDITVFEAAARAILVFSTLGCLAFAVVLTFAPAWFLQTGMRMLPCDSSAKQVRRGCQL